ncbi:MAG: nitrous oxide reductase family maturation protein NosD [Promethearchaeota archaeon]
MRNNRNYKILTFSILFLYIGSIIVYSNDITTNENIPIVNDVKIKNMGYWVISPFLIDDTVPGSDWAWAVSQPWCNLIDGVYVIENVTVDGQNSGNCIHIKNSNVHFIIRNCTIYNADFYSGAGILFEDVNNSYLINNELYSCKIGLSLASYSYNNTINNNTLYSNHIYGIYLNTFSDNNTISNNIVYNHNYGISVITSNFNKICYNKVYMNTDIGIEISGTANSNKIFKNTVINNTNDGFHFYAGLKNVIKENIVQKNSIGIFLEMNSHYNNFSRNFIYNNTEYGVYFYNVAAECTNNLIYNNSFNNPSGINAYDDGSTTQWNNSIIGNYWHDYNGVDYDDNGIGDTPYNIPPDIGRIDYFPIWHDSPNIFINLPKPYEIFGDHINPPEFNVRIKDPNLNKMWYCLNSDPKKYFFLSNETIDQTAWAALSDGYIKIKFYANDTAGNINFSTVIVIKDTIAPDINILSPLPGDYLSFNAPQFIIEISELTLNTTWYTLDDGITNITFSGLNGTIDQNNWTILPDGPITIKFFANDTNGRSSSQEVVVIKDSIYPQISIVSPKPNKFFGISAPNFNITINEINLNTTWYTLDNGITNIIFSGLNGTIDQNNWTILPEGQVTIKFFANDSASNQNHSEIIIYKDVETPEIIINFPIQDDFIGSVAPNFNISIIEPFLNTTWYTLDSGATNFTFEGLTGQINQIEWAKKGTGIVTIRFYANDTLGRIGYAEVLVFKDIDNPEITINKPSRFETFGKEAPYYDISIEEPNLESMWYTIDGGITNFTITQINGTINQAAWNAVSYGNITIRFYAKDLAGNIGYSEIIIKKMKKRAPAIPSYQLLLLIIAIGVITAISLKKKLK